MFKINFRLVDEDIQQFSKINSEQFDKDFGGDISGQIELIFGDRSVGFYHEEVPFGNELIFHWFCRLFEVLEGLESRDSSHYVAMNIMGGNQWVEFVKEGGLRVSLINIPSMTEIQGFITKTPLLHTDNKEWGDILIDHAEFKNEIMNSTLKLLQQINDLNSDLLRSNKLRRIQEYHRYYT
ncbi:hypothetical protein [Paenibacillus lentus]|uniref:Uncharacterized protein n=1 Tax=Paenibacillus lentus TaxID=1338368 RepID=A0A3Q8S3Q6_9BACL|nr:hypothetical protein [Paenibacillus lentus]AZK45317.1 hypothetical protein EIM92_03115 [Paenibacillus lentus]